MFRRFSLNFGIALFFSDLLVLTGVMLSAKHVLLAMPSATRLFGIEGLPWLIFVIIIPVWVVLSVLLSLYDGSKFSRPLEDYSALTLCFIFSSVTSAGLLYLTYRDMSRKLFLIILLVSYLILILLRLRLISRNIYWHYRRRMKDEHRILIAGAGIVGKKISTHIAHEKLAGFKLIGFLDDDPKKRQETLGSLDEVLAVAKKNSITDLIICLPVRAYARMQELLTLSGDLALNIYIVPDYFQWSVYQMQLNEFAGIPMVNLRAPAISEYQRLIKRISDILLSSMGLIVLSPLLLIIAMVVKITDNGPVFFTQVRVGENGRLFKIFKFRTMVPDADKHHQAMAKTDENGRLVYKRKDDPRITPIGRMLRRFSLDELPQLLNVLIGNMSLVGPRPELPELVQHYEPWQRKRFCVPQGMTGWWQIQGRCENPLHLSTETDIYYIEHYSLWLDLYILMRTFWVVLRGKGAY